MEEANKAIQKKLDDISKGYVDELEIGGRNLIANRHSITCTEADYPEETTVSSVINPKGEREITVTSITENNNIRAYRYQFIQTFFSKPIENKEYVLSFDYKTNHSGASVELDWRPAFWYPIFICENTNEEWKRGYVICDWRGTTQGTKNLLLLRTKNDAIS